jgi:NifB/MoaA-like Fe-S oxidoreductase
MVANGQVYGYIFNRFKSRNKMNRRQIINKILHDHIDVNKHEDYTNIQDVRVSFLYEFVNGFTDTEIPKAAIKETLDQLNEH